MKGEAGDRLPAAIRKAIEVNRTDLQNLVDLRIGEAKHLLDGGWWAGAYYLAGYAVECALKACIAAFTDRHDYPDKEFASKCFTHNVESLLVLARLGAHRDVDVQANHVRRANWGVVREWREDSRYSLKTEQEARDLYSAITDAANGAIPWIKTHW